MGCIELLCHPNQYCDKGICSLGDMHTNVKFIVFMTWLECYALVAANTVTLVLLF
jgi:hypothetical protein